jgi:uracil-DNA glycosylase
MNNPVNVKMPSDWKAFLEAHFHKESFRNVTQFVKSEVIAGKMIYPPGPQIFRAFECTPLESIKAVILGQDPYHGPSEAHGLCFSVPEGIRVPPSLRNILKELKSDLGINPPEKSGDLTAWAEQGVLMLNSILTVEHKSPASHKNKGWEEFTDFVIHQLSQRKEHLAFVLWGGFAKSKKNLIDTARHLIIEAPHPAAEVYAGGKAGFFGSKPFSTINQYLEKTHQSPIQWTL